MSTAQQTESVALVTAASVGVLPLAVQQQLELRKLSNQIAGKLSEMNWGKALDLATRRAIADWGRQYGVDPTTEIHVLGGNIYLNAVYYLRRLAQLIARGVVEYAYADHVEADERLERLGGDGVGESNRRMRERIAYQIPDKAASAVVFRVKLRSMSREICGAKWCGNGTRKSDPVGDAFPVESAESRAARRAMRQIVTHVPEEAQQILEVEDAADALGERIAEGKEAFRISEASAAIEPKANYIPDGSRPYEMDVAPAAPMVDREPGDEDADEPSLPL